MSALILPGAQSLVSSILADGWVQARGVLARLWSSRGTTSQLTALQQLDKGYEISRSVAETNEANQRLLETYWTGYLAGLAAGHADLLEAIRELEPAAGTSTRVSTVHNSNTGKAGTILQAGDVHGNITFGR